MTEERRNRLTELLQNFADGTYSSNGTICEGTKVDDVVEHLIVNGVTIPVWCKVCRWRHTKKCIYARANYVTCDNDFCSYGERRTDG